MKDNPLDLGYDNQNADFIDEKGYYINLHAGKRVARPLHRCRTYSICMQTHMIDHALGDRRMLPLLYDDTGQTRWDTLQTILTGLLSPISDSKGIATTNRFLPKLGRYSRMLLRDSRGFASMVLDERYRIYRSTWHSDISAAFGLEDPPTPKELMNYLLGEKFSYRNSILPRISYCERSMLLQYCQGGQVPALAVIYNQPEPIIIWILAQSIKRLMGHLAFRLWATGSDLTPMMKDQGSREYLGPIMGERRPPGDGPSRSRNPRMIEAAKVLMKDPYYHMIITEGIRLNPIPRAYTSRSMAWDTHTAKLHAEIHQWNSLHQRRREAKGWWMHKKLMGARGLLPTTELSFSVNVMPDAFPRPATLPIYVELAELYGKGTTLEEGRVTDLCAKYNDSGAAVTRRASGVRAGYGLTK